jgi:hypothetical protein
MTIFLWYVLGISFFSFILLNYILVVYLAGEHPELYKKLGEPSAFHFLLRSKSLFAMEPYSKFLFERQYQTELKPFHGLYVLSQWIFGLLIVMAIAASALVVHYVH